MLSHSQGDTLLHRVVFSAPPRLRVTKRLNGKRRARAVNGTTTTRYRWGLGWDLLNEENGSGTLTNMYIGHLAEVPGSNPATGAYRYYATDLIRSTRALFDQSKAQVAGYEYTPYGELYASSGSVSTTHRFTGHDWDATAGHYFAPYRYYRPDLARWLSPDPAGFVDGLNVYGYVRGNPVSQLDPLGLTFLPVIINPDAAATCSPCCREVAKEMSERYQKKYPDPEDYMRHCVTSCEVAKKAGQACAFAAGWGHEIQNLGGDICKFRWVRNRQNFEIRDLRDNAAGRRCASSYPGLSCEACCKSQLAYSPSEPRP